MAGTGQGYDLSASTYSPDGRIFQIDYAQKCVDTAPTVLAMICADGILFASQKLKLSKMLVHGTNKRSFALSKNMGAVVTGLLPDGRHLVNIARDQAREFKSVYGDPMSAFQLAERMGSYMHTYTLYGAVRPFGISFLMGATEGEKNKPALYQISPAGHVTKWAAKAVGKGHSLANTELEKLDLSTLTCQEALFHAAKILHKVHDEQKPFELEMHWVCKESRFVHEAVPAPLLASAEDQAKTALEQEEDGE